MSITIDNSVWKRLKEVLSAGEFLRLGIVSGGCYGFQYTFDVDTQTKDDDVVFTQQGCKVAVEKKYILFLEGGTLLFENEMMHSHFVFKNPKVTQGCGCGVSFSLPEEVQ